MDFRINLWGDLVLQHRLSACVHEDFLALRDVLTGGDLSIANLECTIHEGENWPAFFGSKIAPHLEVGPWVTDELKMLGFQAVFHANNKASDFGEGGILSTISRLDEAEICHAGSGRSLTQAAAPSYMATRIGRVAILGAADNGIRGRGSTPVPIPLGCIPSDEGPWYPDRPGVNMLRYEPTYYVDEETLNALRRASELLGWEQEKNSSRWQDRRSESTDTFRFQGTRFAIGDGFRFSTTAEPDDIERNCKWVSEARRNAEFVIVGLHQNGAVWREGLSSADDPPADHTLEYAHRAIDAGADIFTVHGAGKGGVEFYNGKVIIYGTAGFNPHHARVRIPV